MKQYYVYIMTNKSKTLYTGVTGDLERRVYEHKLKLVKGFTKKYNMTILVYFEVTNSAQDAIAREKQIKGWLRAKKIALIESTNPEWRDLGEKLEGDSSLRMTLLSHSELVPTHHSHLSHCTPAPTHYSPLTLLSHNSRGRSRRWF